MMMVKLDSFENIYIDYRILLAIFIIVAFAKRMFFKIKTDKKLFEMNNVTRKIM